MSAKTLCKVCGLDITQCHCIEPGTLHRRNPLPSKVKSEYKDIQPDQCLKCKNVVGLNCDLVQFAQAYKINCALFKSLKPINGKKK